MSALESSLRDAVLRPVRLFHTPSEAGVLAPLVKREIVYRPLVGEQGKRLHHLATMTGHSHRIALAVERLRTD